MNHNIVTLATTGRQEAMNQFIVIIIALTVILLVILILGSKNSKFRKLVVWMFEEDATSSNEHKEFLNGQKRSAKTPRTEYVILVQKIDERKRVVDARGHSRLFNEYYELIFRTRKGEPIHTIVDKNIYRQIPFNQQGSLTFLRDNFIKFKSASGIIENKKEEN